jgi:acyl-homoserine-lactone acylase
VLPASAVAADPSAVIRRTSHGVPHILAKDWEGLGYGYGYAFAEDNICVIADSYMTVNAQRSRFIGPDATYKFQGNGAIVNNLNSDFFFQKIIDAKTIEKMIDQPPPQGPRPEIKQIVTGYVKGYNRWLAETGAENIPDKTCRGKPWVRPLVEMDAYRRFYQLALLASAGVAIDGIGGAQPLTPAPGGGSASYDALADAFPLAIGSNAIGLGGDATDNGKGMLLGNPHFPWYGSERFYESHLTIPGKIDVEGASLFGVPLVLIGHTKGLAWSHTVSTAFRFTPFELKLIPGMPTSYLYDGQVKQMTSQTVKVQSKKADGSLEERTRTLWSSHHGPILTSILGLPIFPWTPERAFALGDANAANFRYLNHFFETNRAQSTDDLYDVLRRNQGIPWVNTLSADSAGKAFYADISVVPNVTNEKVAQCNTKPVGQAVSTAVPGLPVLDGSTSACEWADDPDAAQKGIFGPSHLPHLFRRDYVENGNDSYWLTNPHQPIEGFARIIGNEKATRSLRTRSGLVMIEEELKDGGKFTLPDLQTLAFANRQYAGELLRDELVAMCKDTPGAEAACPILEKWDLRDDLASRGALLFRAWFRRARAANGGVFSQPFNVADPVNTPRGLNSSNPELRQALLDGISEMNGAGIPLDAPLGAWQYVKRGDEKIPIHGGPGTLGVFNAINVVWSPTGYSDVPHGSSFVQAVKFIDGACGVDARSILTYSLSANPDSPYHADQTRLFTDKKWKRMLFCEDQIASDPNLRITQLGSAGGVLGRSCGGKGAKSRCVLASFRLRKRSFGGRAATPLVAEFKLSRKARVELRVIRGRKTVRRLKLGMRRAGKVHRVVVPARRLRTRGAYRIRLDVRAGSRRESATLTARRR